MKVLCELEIFLYEIDLYIPRWKIFLDKQRKEKLEQDFIFTASLLGFTQQTNVPALTIRHYLLAR